MVEGEECISQDLLQRMEQFWHNISEIFIAYTKWTHKQEATNYGLNGEKKKKCVSSGWQVKTLMLLGVLAEFSHGTTFQECQMPGALPSLMVSLASPYIPTMSCSEVRLAD